VRRRLGAERVAIFGHSVFTERTCLSRLEARMGPRGLLRMGRDMLSGEESSLFGLPRTVRGFRFSMAAMWEGVSRIDLNELAPALRLPVFFLLGRRDHWVPPDTAVAYLDALTAPRKELVWFERSGHEPCADEPARFNATMAELVRPLLSPPDRVRP
jgi:pimeloyl-ACP methyl ester carboxylesterase